MLERLQKKPKDLVHCAGRPNSSSLLFLRSWRLLAQSDLIWIPHNTLDQRITGHKACLLLCEVSSQAGRLVPGLVNVKPGKTSPYRLGTGTLWYIAGYYSNAGAVVVVIYAKMPFFNPFSINAI